MGLAVVGGLQAVFDFAEEAVGGGEAAVFGVREEVFVAESGEGEEGAAVAEPGGAGAVEALEALGEELDIADASGGEFDVEAVVAMAAGGEFFTNAFAGEGDGLDGGEVEGGRVGEGFDGVEEFASGAGVAGGDAGLDHHLEFPVAGAGAVVLERAVEGEADFAEATVGAEAQVDAVAHPFDGVSGE